MENKDTEKEPRTVTGKHSQYYCGRMSNRLRITICLIGIIVTLRFGWFIHMNTRERRCIAFRSIFTHFQNQACQTKRRPMD